MAALPWTAVVADNTSNGQAYFSAAVPLVSSPLIQMTPATSIKSAESAASIHHPTKPNT